MDDKAEDKRRFVERALAELSAFLLERRLRLVAANYELMLMDDGDGGAAYLVRTDGAGLPEVPDLRGKPVTATPAEERSR